jgi:hypothetical protein
VIFNADSLETTHDLDRFPLIKVRETHPFWGGGTTQMNDVRGVEELGGTEGDMEEVETELALDGVAYVGRASFRIDHTPTPIARAVTAPLVVGPARAQPQPQLQVEEEEEDRQDPGDAEDDEPADWDDPERDGLLADRDETVRVARPTPSVPFEVARSPSYERGRQAVALVRSVIFTRLEIPGWVFLALASLGFAAGLLLPAVTSGPAPTPPAAQAATTAAVIPAPAPAPPPITAPVVMPIAPTEVHASPAPEAPRTRPVAAPAREAGPVHLLQPARRPRPAAQHRHATSIAAELTPDESATTPPRAEAWVDPFAE